VLERIQRARLTREAAEAELAVLVDHAVSLSIGWPEIATRLGVTRQAARQHYQRRHGGSLAVQERRS
jgi:predicted transcriptional regulator